VKLVFNKHVLTIWMGDCGWYNNSFHCIADVLHQGYQYQEHNSIQFR